MIFLCLYILRCIFFRKLDSYFILNFKNYWNSSEKIKNVLERCQVCAPFCMDLSLYYLLIDTCNYIIEIHQMMAHKFLALTLINLYSFFVQNDRYFHHEQLQNIDLLNYPYFLYA